MLSQHEKFTLFKDFLSSDYYCDMTVSRNREEVETIRDTLWLYEDWYLENVVNPSQELIDTVSKGNEALLESEVLLLADEYSDLSDLDTLLKETFTLANLVVFT